MDLQLANTLYSKFKNTQKKEEFEDDTTTVKPVDAPTIVINTNTNKSTLNNIYLQIFSLLIGIFAAYLSWSCNTAKGIDTVLKVIYSIFAFFFGTLYLIYYVIFRAGRCYPQQVMYIPQQYPPQQYPLQQYPPQQYPPQQYPPQNSNLGGKKGSKK